MKIFVTGSTGFIGQHLIKALLAEGHEVHFLLRDKNKAGLFSNEKAIPHIGSLENIESYREIFNQNIEVVYHLAAIPGQKWGFRKKDYDELNTKATERLIKACYGKIKRFIFTSSINAISDNQFRRDDYGKSKKRAEEFIQSFPNKEWSAVILRPAVVYGPQDTQGLMLKLCRLIKRKKFYFLGSGRNVLPFVYISDLVSAFLKAKNASPAAGPYEIIGPDLPTFQEAVTQIASHLKAELPRINISLWLARPAALFSESVAWLLKTEPLITQHRVDIITRHKPLGYQKAQRELGYNPKIIFSEGIKKTIEWYQKNGYL
ncbi:MAG: hypothetical protein COY66_00640 [Candidatus Kerfeldbacteria bacterium CG_4_10_14_0_8_um_filter_42_10]|uniref:NAD-dependent epimerase/dehydratase domain-containing protein n=1 Tax=Candidatus Kerfeldbacteria bacterium CG_4_10_14_0_8_um_filter_42_10 TaxID=2014248 RepID=A0A2M7RLA0_9BACT|nr:MAG: hypothetical protein COY66_00640 [Candidatus Kerfeldbacteria bacterium CG_4_10_14_0_8_um_filter_42_10]